MLPATGTCVLKILPKSCAVNIAPSRLTRIILCHFSSAYDKLDIMMRRVARVRDTDVELVEVLGCLLDGGGDRGFRAYVGLIGHYFLACGP